MKDIIVNGLGVSTPDNEASYDYIVMLGLRGKGRHGVLYTVTYAMPRGIDRRDGSLTPGQSVKIENGMVFNVVYTGNA